MKNIAIFASGKGSNANNIINYFKEHPNIYIKLIITNNPKSGVIDLANKSKIEYLVFNKNILYKRVFKIQTNLNKYLNK